MARFVGPRIVTSGLVLCLDAANTKSYPGTGTTWTDLSRNNNTGTLVSGPTFSSANGGQIVFDGTDDRVDCGVASQIGSALTGLTASVWINPTRATSSIILENGTLFTTNTFYLAQEDASNFSFLIYGNAAEDRVNANYTYQTNTWYNLVGVWSAGSRVNIYTNGILTNGTRIGSASTTLINGNTNLFVGSRAGTSLPFKGNIATSSIYNRSLTAAEVAQNYIALRGRYGV